MLDVMSGDLSLHIHPVQMWLTFSVILGVLILYVTEWLPIEATSVGVICVLVVLFQIDPVVDAAGKNLLEPERLIAGFANPALITVLSLLVVGQGMVRTGVLERGARIVLRLSRNKAWLSIAIALVTVLAVSAFLNNVPVVVIFIPIMQTLADRLKRPVSKVMMGLSFVAVLGGSTTLIGSGSNLLVSGALLQLGDSGLGFFEFTIPGLVLASVGLLYVLIVAPHLLPDRASLASRIMERSGKYFLAQIAVTEGSRLDGSRAVGGVLSGLPDVRVRSIFRGDQVLIPPFHDFAVQPGDQVVVAASRKALSDAMSHDPGLLHPLPDGDGGMAGGKLEPQMGERVLAEVLVAPGARLVGQRLPQSVFQYRTGCVVLGIQRRSHMFRSRMTDIPLEPGDILLIQGEPHHVEALRRDPDVVLMEWSAEELPVLHDAQKAGFIFLTVVALAATGTLPIVGAGLIGAVAMVASGVLNVRQASRAIDARIVTMIPATLAMGLAMQETGGAAFLAHAMMAPMQAAGPAAILSAFFLLAAVVGNVVGSNACAVLFTPIAVGLAQELGIQPHVFAITVVLAANCAFATPIGYQTSLLVMGPGHYRFGDFVKVGGPLIFLLWIAFTLFMPWYYGL